MQGQRYLCFTTLSFLVVGLIIVFSLCTAESSDTSGEAAATTGVYRNLFKEIGKNDAEIAEKVNEAWEQLFYGDDETQRIYYEVGPDMAYIHDVGNGDVRSEGMSYGMMFCIQLDKKAEFDKLWKWAKTNMYYSSGTYKGYFAWHCRVNGEKVEENATPPAPDGDEYFAMSLIFADKRWGSGSGIYDYGTEAQNLLHEMLHHREGINMFNLKQKQVVFCPTSGGAGFTDPSYHLPAFYEIWARYTKSHEDREKWFEIAETSRKFFAKAAHSVTGLSPDYANWNGSPVAEQGNHQYFYYDAWRTVANAAVDYAWWRRDDFEPEFADRLQDFFNKKGIYSYGNLWTLKGSSMGRDHSSGLVAMNAVASLAATQQTVREKFLKELWNASIPSGKWRYYDGTLYMMGLLHCSGNFKAYY